MSTTERPSFTPAADIYEMSDAYEIVIDMPGVDDKKVDIELDRNLLKVTGHPVEEPTAEGYREYRLGVYQRSFTLGTGIDRDKVSAKMEDGVLRLRLPKGQELQPRKIAITRG